MRATVKMTEEQKEVVESLKRSDHLKINAFAGTGKTTTLRLLTEAYPQYLFLYLAFNRSIAQEAKQKFPKNTHIYTTHGLAYRYTKGELNLSKLKGGDYKPREIMDMFYLASWDVASLILDFFNAFCYSDLTEISPETIRKLRVKDQNLRMKIKIVESSLSATDIINNKLSNEFIAEHVNKLWEGMLNGDIEMTHNFYLKYFHINIDKYKEKLEKYDVVLLDEAQDTNDVTLDIVRKIPTRKKVIVGDRHQQIYLFRKSVNAMEKFQSDTTLYLSVSFRITHDIADRASHLLKLLKGEEKPIRATKSGDPSLTENNTNSYAIITRTNSTLIRELDSLLRLGREDITTVRHPSDIFRLPLSVYYFHLYCTTGDKTLLDHVQEKWILSFNSFDELTEYAGATEDVELTTAIKMVKEGGINIPALYKEAERLYRNPQARVYLTTAHTSKGLEWEVVRLTDDFPDLKREIARAIISKYGKGKAAKLVNPLKIFRKMLKEGIQDAVEVGEEINLYYVAMTRAKNTLIDKTPNESLCLLPEKEINDALVRTIQAEVREKE